MRFLSRFFPHFAVVAPACAILLLLLTLPPSAQAFSSVDPSTTTTTTAKSITPTDTKAAEIPALQDFDYHTNDRLPWLQEGYNTWEWEGHKINYLELGDSSKPAVLLIHGFGASAYHFRYNIPVLARDYHVFAFDLLGFGLSDKPLIDYSAEVWRDQAVAFIQEIIQKPTTVAGNSLGGFTALYTSASADRMDKDIAINGCVLLNGAGRFRDPTGQEEPENTPNYFTKRIQTAFQRLVIGASFLYTKQPSRIAQILRQVYPVSSQMVDEELVRSIQYPSLDPNAAEVFYRVITKNGSGPQVYVDDLLERLNDDDCPLMLCWGEQDPWIKPQAADKIQALYPASQRVSIDAGHCPHDEAPDQVNAALLSFLKSIHA